MTGRQCYELWAEVIITYHFPGETEGGLVDFCQNTEWEC